MNWLDIVLLIILFASAIGGLANGLIKTVLSLVGLIVGVVLAGHYYNAVAGWITFVPDNIANIIAFALILILVLLIAAILGTILTRAVSAILLGWLNRLTGLVAGIILGAIWCGALLAIWVKYMGAGDVISGSVIAPIIMDKFPLVLALLPGDFDIVRRFFQ